MCHTLQVILFEIDCAIFYTNLHELFCQFISWTNWVNPGKFMDNCWISCQVMDDMEKLYKDLIIINLYLHFFWVTKYHSTLWKHQRQISRKKLRKFFRKRKLSLTNVRNWQHIQKVLMWHYTKQSGLKIFKSHSYVTINSYDSWKSFFENMFMFKLQDRRRVWKSERTNRISISGGRMNLRS